MTVTGVPTRRRFLATTMLTAAGLGAGASAARAFSIEPADAAASAEYLAAQACRKAGVSHARLAAEAAAIIAGRDLADTERQAIAQAYACPICGCTPFSGP